MWLKVRSGVYQKKRSWGSQAYLGIIEQSKVGYWWYLVAGPDGVTIKGDRVPTLKMAKQWADGVFDEVSVLKLVP